MKVAIIANPYSGGKRGEKILPEIKKRLASLDIKATFFESRYPGHAIEICSALEVKSYDAIAALGGDGTNFHMLNGLLKKWDPDELPPLGIIPVGSGNSFAVDLDIKTVEDGIQALMQNHIKKVDICSFTQGKQTLYFVNCLGLGFVTDVAKTASKFKMLGDFSYVFGVLHRTIGLAFYEMELVADGKQYIEENCFVEFCNSRFTGGNMLMAPGAKIDDGYMDIVIAKPLSRMRLLTALPKIFKGTHVKLEPVRVIRAKEAMVKTKPLKTLLPDGEILGATPTQVKTHKKMIRYLM